MQTGRVVLLNGAPRAGKSSVACALQAQADSPWMNLGIDAILRHVTPAKMQPGIGLRPGGERKDLEDFVGRSYLALYKSIAAHANLGFNVIADVGHHDSYVNLNGNWALCLRELQDIEVMIVGVFCPLDDILERRLHSEGPYLTQCADGEIPKPILLWQEEVHKPGIYDLEIDTARKSPDECAKLILSELLKNRNFGARKMIIAAY
ncbi:Chloramphenicol 3-O phosphotransferase [Pseudovibrio axinellae]|uniref:Chloramphenicol 3-O phosphotransferase n=1 Tax=Pseudovibrio axinellae TaxID=989403 RepID=A0A161UZX6_9HYPH|nr:phosphotransferase [Pseudovibrio axinellae]KZL05035.1 Chloramphenicol 3-O phosphotransferase [Pseudovibrio axinellae]SER65511.1 chloramphenicol 3-O phosphotransferase [Pseudovibrio axinellae]